MDLFKIERTLAFSITIGQISPIYVLLMLNVKYVLEIYKLDIIVVRRLFPVRTHLNLTFLFIC